MGGSEHDSSKKVNVAGGYVATALLLLVMMEISEDDLAVDTVAF